METAVGAKRPGRVPAIVIVGGGLAGLAAATVLSQHQFPVVVLESRPRLGGRASSFQDPTTGEWIDNCQHVVLGCCTYFQTWCHTIGIDGYFQTASSLKFMAPSGSVSELRSSALPAPLHLLPSFLGLSYLSTFEKISLGQGLRALAATQSFPKGMNFLEWLQQQKMPPRVIERFFHVVLVSALSEHLNQIDPHYARKVFVDSFLRNASGWQVQLPTVPLGQLYGSELSHWLNAQGSTLRTQAGVASLKSQGDHHAGTAISVVLKDGSELPADEIILAVPWKRVAELVPEVWRDRPEFRLPGDLPSAPIRSIHLWFDRPITDLPHVAFIEGMCQWLFARSPEPESGQPSSYYYQVVISASLARAESSQTELTRQVLAELQQYFAIISQAQLLQSRVVTEHQAVFSPRPGIESLRPTQKTSIPNLYLAGDWTETGWPATMEGAVRSGYFAAKSLLDKYGVAVELPRELPTTILSRLLFSLKD